MADPTRARDEQETSERETGRTTAKSFRICHEIGSSKPKTFKSSVLDSSIAMVQVPPVVCGT